MTDGPMKNLPENYPGDDNLITRRKAIKKNIDDIRERKQEIAKVIKGLSEENTPENKNLIRQLLDGFDTLSQQENQYIDIMKSIVVIHEQATKDIADDIEKSIEEDRAKLKELKERKAEEAEETEFLKNAPPDVQAQQAEIDKDIEELKATLLEFKTVAEQAVAASQLNEKLVEKLQLHKKKKATMMEVRKQKASDLEAKAKQAKEELDERISKIQHQKEITKKKQRQLEDLRKEALRIGIQLNPEDEKNHQAAMSAAEALMNETDRIPPLANEGEEEQTEEKVELDEEAKEKKRAQIRENVRIERERQAEVNRIIREKLAAMEERKKRVQEIRKLLEQGDKSQEVLANVNATLQEEQAKLSKDIPEAINMNGEAAELLAEVKRRATNGSKDNGEDDIPPPLPSVPPPEDSESSTAALQIPPMDLEYTLLNAKRNLENLTAMRERLEQMQEAGEDLDDEQAAIIEQLEDLNMGMEAIREEEKLDEASGQSKSAESNTTESRPKSTSRSEANDIAKQNP